MEPEEMTVANCLILIAEDKFEPRNLVTMNEHNIEFFPTNVQKAHDSWKEIKDKLEKEKENNEMQKKLEDAREELNKQIASAKVTQLDILHDFAKQKLGSRIQNPGAFIRSGSPMIGTHVVNFNANMNICFLWGSLTKHVTVDPKEVQRQLPFVKTVITRYL
jgi:hypothetical protein